MVVAVLLMVLWTASDAAAQATIFLVRHAERADAGSPSGAAMANDPELSDAGRARAASLAAILADAQVTAIYTTEYKRTRQTAEPLAAARKLAVTTIKANEPTRLLESLKGATGNVLVVGHSNTVPDILLGLGIRTPVTIKEDEYDNLFILTMGPEPKLVRLRFR
jgi:broad specificity phosphatase PhoE